MATEIERLAVLFEANTRQFTNAMAKLQKDTQRAIGASTKSIQGLDAQLKAMGTAASRVAGLFGIGLGVQQLVSAVGRAIDHVSKLVDTADKLGISTKNLQELAFAGGQTGVDFDQLSTALGFFNKNVGEASRGGGELLKILEANNVAIRDQAGNLLPPIELLGRYADLVMNAGSAQEQATLATKAFGRAGADLIPLLMLGREGLRGYAEQAARTGQIIDDELARKGEALGDKWAEVTGKMSVDFTTFSLTTIEWALKLGSALDALIEKTATYLGLRDEFKPLTADDLGPRQLRALQELTAKLSLPGAAPAAGGVDRFAAAFGDPTVIPEIPETIKKLKVPLGDAAAGLKKVVDQMDELRNSAREVLGTFVDGLLAGEGVIHSLGNALEQLGKKLLDSGLDMLITQLLGNTGSIFRTTSPISSAFAGLFAEGGTLGAGKWGIAGENGPEMVRGPATIAPMAANANRPQKVIVVVEAHATPDLYLRARSQAARDTAAMLTARDKDAARRPARAG